MKSKFKKLLVVLGILILIYFILQIKLVDEMLNLILISFIISYTLRPIEKKLIRCGINRKLSAILLILSGISLLTVTCILLVPSILRESLTINNTISQIKDFIDDIYNRLEILNKNKTMFIVINTVYDKMNNIIIIFLNKTLDKIIKLGESILTLVVIPVIVYYLLSENEKIANTLLIFVPVRSRSIMKSIGRNIDKILGRYITGQLILSLLIMIATFIVLIVLKVDYPILLSLINGIFNIIPYFGPLFGAIPAVIMALLNSPQTAVWTAILLYIIQQIEGDIISPKITGDSVNIHPLVVILLLIVGGKIGGFIGMVLAIPLGVVIKIICEDLNYYLF